MAAVGSKGGAAGCSNGAGCTSGVAAGGSNWAAAGPNGRPDPYKTGGTNGIGGGTDQLLGQGHGNRGTSSMVFGLALGRASGPSSGMMVSLDTALAGSMGLLGGLSGAMVPVVVVVHGGTGKSAPRALAYAYVVHRLSSRV